VDEREDLGEEDRNQEGTLEHRKGCGATAFSNSSNPDEAEGGRNDCGGDIRDLDERLLAFAQGIARDVAAEPENLRRASVRGSEGDEHDDLSERRRSPDGEERDEGRREPRLVDESFDPSSNVARRFLSCRRGGCRDGGRAGNDPPQLRHQGIGWVGVLEQSQRSTPVFLGHGAECRPLQHLDRIHEVLALAEVAAALELTDDQEQAHEEAVDDGRGRLEEVVVVSSDELAELVDEEPETDPADHGG